MNVLLAENISRSYGERILFQNITLGLERGEKTALVARNGTGKSTLLKIIAGHETSESGKVVVRDGFSIGYLSQDPPFEPGISVRHALMDERNPAVRALQQYNEALKTQDQEQLRKAMEAMDAADAWTLEHRLREICDKLIVPEHDRRIDTLSGGQVKRVALAAVLVQNPDILILDEPTNHLDISMIEWLEQYLEQSNLTLLMVTHDRYFLDAVCDNIVELDQGELFFYKGNYAYFLEKKAEREAAQLAEVEKARNIYRRELEWVRRMPQARGTKAKSRLDAFEHIREKAFSLRKQREFEINSRMKRLGSKILELIKVSKSFGDHTLIQSFTYSFRKGERIGVVGPNGAGKSTLLKLIIGDLQPDAGKVVRGETLEIGFYRQELHHLPADRRVIEVVREVGEVFDSDRYAKATAAQMLQQFDFPPALQYNFVHQLSGGEKKRLALLLILLRQPNFLILDEPTNDLDLITLGKLEAFLENYPGCMIIVSHDRHFVDRLADQLFVFEGEGNVRVFGGSYTEYRLAMEEEQQLRKQAEQATRQRQQTESQPATSGVKSRNRLSYKEKLEFEKLPEELEALEKKKAELELILPDVASEHEALQKITTELAEVSRLIEEKTDRWLYLSEFDA